jgi:hypothetical protein
LADITGRGVKPKEGQRRPWQEVATETGGDPSGAGARIRAVYQDGGAEFVTKQESSLARNKELRAAVKRGEQIARQQLQTWRVRWGDDRTPAEVIAAKLLSDPALAREVYKRLHSHSVANAAKEKRRSGY